MGNNVYSTDDWKPYENELKDHPTAYHVITKSETVAIERNNSDTRHWFGRFHRKTKIVSRCPVMVDLTIGLFAKFRVNGSIDLMRDLFLSLVT